jgi:putative PEP-CTERM system TPR-repeat lipoprotein
MPSVFLAGALSLEVGDLEQAQNAFVAYLARFPGNLQARKMLALTFLNKKQPQSAVELLAPFVKLDVRDFEFFAIAGQAFLQVNDVERALATLKRAATLNPESPDASAHLGLAKLAAGAEREGLAELERAVALGPRDAGPDRHLALAYLARKRFDDVARVADNLERRLPRSPEPHWYRGLVSSARKQPAAARVHHDRALKVAPGYLPAAASLADLDRQEGRTSETRARFESVHRADPRSVEPVLALAKLDGDEGKHQEGVRRLQRTADDHPDNAQIQVLLASFQSRLGRDDDAVQSARRARELNPRDPGALELLGQLQLRTGDSAGAMLSFTTLTGLRPRYMPGWLQLIQAQRIAGERRAALGSAQEAQRISPWEPNLLTLWGDVLLEEKRFPDALKLARLGQEKHPGRAFGYALEGQIRLLEGKPEQALALYREADRREPNGAFRIRIHQAQSAQMGGDAPVDLLKAWIETHPDDSTVQRYTADALVRLGRMDEAVRMYENLLKSSPRDFRLLNNLADALLRKGDVRAMDYAQQAYQIEPTNAVVLTTLGAVLLSRGQLVEAVQSLQKATELDAESQEARLYFAKALIAAGDRVRAKGELQRLVASANQSVHTAEARAILGRL